MEKILAGVICLLLNFSLTGPATQVIPKTEEQACVKLLPSSQAKNFVIIQEHKLGIPQVIADTTGIKRIKTVDYNQPAKKVIKDIGDTIVPLIIFGLSLVPGGPLIGGVVAGIWGVLSPLLSNSMGRSPFEQLIDNIQDEIRGAQKGMKDLSDELGEEIYKGVDAKFREIITNVILGKLSRNDYICSKYALFSERFSRQVKMNRTINESLRCEMIVYVQSCDNFLKDTAESFVFPKFAEILWIPSAIMTLLRMSFLTEIANYGFYLRTDEAILSKYWSEMKVGLARHFELYASAVCKRLGTFTIERKPFDGYNFTETEYEGCRLQQQIIYFDRQRFPFGIPKNIHIFDDSGHLTFVNCNISENDEPCHIRAYYNEISHIRKKNSMTILNCFMGPEIISRVSTESMSFMVTYVPKKSYNIRVLYFVVQSFCTVKDKHSKEGKANSFDTNNSPNAELSSDKHLFVQVLNGNTIKITITDGKPNENSIQRFVLKTGFHALQCDISDKCYAASQSESIDAEFAEPLGFTGSFVIENLVTFNVYTEAESKGRISVEQQGNAVLILGVEIIVLPIIT